MRPVGIVCTAIVASLFVSPPSTPDEPLLRARASAVALIRWADSVPLELPPGHPPVDDAFALPPGHPPIGDAFALPPGHPPVGHCPARGRADADDDEDAFVPIPRAVVRPRAEPVDL